VRSTEAVWIGIAGAIWVVGILFAILGRVVSRERTNKDAFLSVQKIQAVETLLLRNPDAEELGHTLLDIMNDRHLDMARRTARLRAPGRCEDDEYRVRRRCHRRVFVGRPLPRGDHLVTRDDKGVTGDPVTP